MDVPFFRPQIDETTIAAVSEVIRSGWLTNGPKTEEFERRFAQYVGARHAVMLNSCTAALHLSLASLDLKAGDEVITTTYTFAATAEVIEYYEARPVLVDVKPETLTIDERQIEAKITSRTRAIIPVHYAGHPCEMDAILAIASRHALPVIEDAAHCTPAYYKECPVGSIGTATCFSFYANKCLTTGEGGMLTTDDEQLAEKVRLLRLHGLSKGAAQRYGKQGSWKYDIILRGHKYNPTDIAAAIGLGQLAHAGEFYRRRRHIAALYRELLGSSPDIELLIEEPNVQSSWHIFPIRLRGAASQRRDEIIEQLKAQGVHTTVHFIPLHMHTYYREKYGYAPEEFPVAYDSYRRLITLPVYPGLRDEEVAYIGKQVMALVVG